MLLKTGETGGVSLIIPAFNEASQIGEMASESVRAMDLVGRDYEIIFVDDGSTDDTFVEIQRAAQRHENTRCVRLPENRGKGNAIRRGFQASSKDLVCCIDADLDINPYQVGRLIEEMEKTGADVVVGSKRKPDSEVDYPGIRKLYSNVYYLLILLLFRLPVRDTQTGIKLFKREVLSAVLPRVVSMQYVMDLELLLVANFLGFRISETPVKVSFQREYGRIGYRDVRNIIVDTMSIFYRFYILGYYGSPLKPVASHEPRISVVVPARSLDPMLDECVRKCGELNYSNFDIKLVLDRPEDPVLVQEGSRVVVSGEVGPARKRNLGVEDSAAEVIAFIDSDAYPDYDWLKNAVAYFEDETVAAVGGPAITPPGENRRKRASGMIYSATLVSGNTRYRYRPHGFKVVNDYPTSNLLVRKTDFDAVGGFNEEFYPGEDTVLCLKLTRDLGKQILYVPNVLVNHHRRALLIPHCRQVYSYAVHRGFFVRKFPETSKKLQYFVPSLFTLAFVAGLVGSFLSPWILWPFISVMCLYLLVVMVSSIKSLEIMTNVLVFPGIIATHFTYGFGFIRGLLSRKMKEQ